MKPFIKSDTNAQLINAMNTLGEDDSAWTLRFKFSKKTDPIKAIFNKKEFKKFHHPLQWEQTYPKRLGI